MKIRPGWCCSVPARMMATGLVAWWRHCWLTEPSSMPVTTAVRFSDRRAGAAWLGVATPAEALARPRRGWERLYVDTVLGYYRALWNAGAQLDVVPVTADLTGYDVVVAPALHLWSWVGGLILVVMVKGGANAKLAVISALSSRLFLSSEVHLFAK